MLKGNIPMKTKPNKSEVKEYSDVPSINVTNVPKIINTPIPPKMTPNISNVGFIFLD